MSAFTNNSFQLNISTNEAPSDVGQSPKKRKVNENNNLLEVQGNERSQMQMSMTTPLVLGQPKTQPIPKDFLNNIRVQTTPEIPKINIEGKDKKVEKTGGILLAPSDNKPNKPATQQNIDSKGDETKNTQTISEKYFTLTQLFQHLFSFAKLKDNKNLTPTQIQTFIDLFGLLTQNPNVQEQRRKDLRAPEKRKDIFKNKFLNSEKDGKILQQIHNDLSLISLKLIQKNGYLSNKGCAQLIKNYIQINRKTLYSGKFQYKNFKEPGVHFQTSSSFNNILIGLNQIKQCIFLYYHKTLSLLANRNPKERSSFIQSFQKQQGAFQKLFQNIWQSFSNIVTTAMNDKRQTTISYSFQINILIECLNMYFTLHHHAFNANNIQRKVLPFLGKPGLFAFFERSQTIQMRNIDKFVLNLLLTYPFNVANYKNNPDVIKFLDNEEISLRYSYLILLERDNVNPEEISPLKQCQTAVFLENYLKINQSFQSYSPQKQAFIFNSICEMLKDNFSELFHKQTYKLIFRYIDYIIYSMFDQQQDSQQDYNPIPQTLRLSLNVCRVAKIATMCCFASSNQSTNLKNFVSLVKNDARTLSTFFRKSISLIQAISAQDGEEQFKQIEQYLQQYQISLQVIYELFFRLIIYDARYFQGKSQIIQQQQFQSVGHFYQTIFTQYIYKYIDIANYFHLALLALSSIISTGKYVLTIKNIMEQISQLQKRDLELMNEENTLIQKNQLQFAVEKMLQVKQCNSNCLLAYGSLILTILQQNVAYFDNDWMRLMSMHFKKIMDSYHPTVVSKYAQILVVVLEFLNNRSDLSPEVQRNIEKHFNFKFINIYLHNTLGFQFDRQNVQMFNKFMRCRKYAEVQTAVRLIKAMSNLYLKNKEHNSERIPLQARRLIEIQNNGNNFQLRFNKETVSYSVGLIIVLLSREFAIDSKLKRKYPCFVSDLYQSLINLNKISRFLHHEVNLKVYQLQNRQLQVKLNDQLKLKQAVIQYIKKNPTFLSLQFLISWGSYKQEIKKQMLTKLRPSVESINAQSLVIYSHYIKVFWKQFTSGQLKMISRLDAWNQLTEYLNRFKKIVFQIDREDYQTEIKNSMDNIYQLSIIIKNASIEEYATFVTHYYSLFFVQRPNSIDFWNQIPPHYRQSITYFFSIRSLLSKHQFDYIAKSKLKDELKDYLFECLDIKQKFLQRKNAYDDLLHSVEFGIGLLFDLNQKQSQTDFLNQATAKINKIIEQKEEIPMKIIIILLLLNGRASKSVQPFQLKLQGSNWQLLSNIIKPNQYITQLLLLDLDNFYNKHPIFFVSICHYLVNLAKTAQLASIQTFQHIKVNKSFIQIVMTLLQKSINEHNSYYTIWVVQILSEMVLNQQIQGHDQIQIYKEIRKSILNNKIFNDRINYLLLKMHAKNGIQSCQLKFKKYSQIESDKLFLAEKLELIALIRLLTFIYFDQKHNVVREEEQQIYHKPQKSAEQKQQQNFIQLMLNITPLITKLISTKETYLSIESNLDQSLSSIKIDHLKAKSKNITSSGIKEIQIKQAHAVWDQNSTALDLLSEVSNYQFASLCITWISKIISFQENKRNFHSFIQRDQFFDNKINNLVLLIDSICKKLQFYKHNERLIDQILNEFNYSVYSSLQISKEMHFTNCNSLNSHIEINQGAISYKFSQDILVLYLMLENIFTDLNCIKTKSAVNYKKIKKDLKRVQKYVKKIDVNIQFHQKATTFRNESDKTSRNYTQRTFY